MDFSTLALRRAMCEAALTVNRCTALQLYLEVRPIIRDGAIRFGTASEADLAVDWVVVMRRFPQLHCLKRCASAGALTEALMRRLADDIAE
mgnify:CR=1 FL=1